MDLFYGYFKEVMLCDTITILIDATGFKYYRMHPLSVPVHHLIIGKFE